MTFIHLYLCDMNPLLLPAKIMKCLKNLYFPTMRINNVRFMKWQDNLYYSFLVGIKILLKLGKFSFWIWSIN